MPDRLAPPDPATSTPAAEPATAFNRRQPALGLEPPAAMSLQWRSRGDAAALWRALQALAQPEVVIGIGAPLAAAAGVVLPGLQPFQRLQRGRFTMPALQQDVWALVTGPDASTVFERADALRTTLAPLAELARATSLFAFRGGHDLTGYKDGTENPTGDEAWAAALQADGDGDGMAVGGSHVLVQHWLHFRDRLAALTPHARDNVMGRRLEDDEEIAEAPETAHVKRTAQEDFEPPAFLLRRSMPWGDARRQGLEFIAYAAEQHTLQRQLERMMGIEDGLQDALLGHSQAEASAYYWCPPWNGRTRVLPPAAVPAAAAGAPLPLLQPPTVRVLADGPLLCEGTLRIAGRTATQARLCRCGRSAGAPYCDDSHLQGGFRASGEVPPVDEPQVDVPPTVLQVEAMPDGPLLLHGPVTLASDSGRVITRCHGPTLCRCGQSANKPFCDGSHAAVGFSAAAG
ncbi:Dyp-type peroxidase [Pseudorhodoferax sp.]|uniref:Dyp-type peroxidase n=1 Tax=Pseudorhodoferax sp. TaxID=1993553 RepID=UPI002DD6383A|nr:Dyp-type peroxidase [Pseudorhodoferax sp.]